MKVRKSRMSDVVVTENFWPSFTDLISTISIILFFLMLLTFVQNIITSNKLRFAETQVKEAETNLITLSEQLDDIEESLRLKRRELRLAEKTLDEQQLIIDQSNKELVKLTQRLEGIAIFRVEILENVKRAIEQQLGKTSQTGQDLVYVGANGNIVISETLVFDTGSAQIKEDGKRLLDSLAIAFEKILNDSNVRQNIDAINIQGHADKRGDIFNNRTLSTNRAAAVVNYMMKSNPNLEKKYGEYFAASGYSEFRPVDTAETQEAYAKNRRIEISVILKDPNIKNLINEYLKETEELLN